jgi:hypothetical protein
MFRFCKLHFTQYNLLSEAVLLGYCDVSVQVNEPIESYKMMKNITLLSLLITIANASEKKQLDRPRGVPLSSKYTSGLAGNARLCRTCAVRSIA